MEWDEQRQMLSSFPKLGKKNYAQAEFFMATFPTPLSLERMVEGARLEEDIAFVTKDARSHSEKRKDPRKTLGSSTPA